MYGYLPPSSHLVVTPADANQHGFTDGSPHRAPLPSAYHRYLATGTDLFYRPDTEEMQMLLRPLFYTSFLIDDQLDDEGLTTRGPVVISSASSKTAIAAAFLLARRDGVELVALTSPGSAEFVEGLGIYGRTVTYDAIDSLERGPATYVDVSGDGEVRRAVHSHYGDALAYSMAVGVTHWEDLGAGGGRPSRPGADPVLRAGSRRQALQGLGRGRDGDEGRRCLAPVLRVDRRLARADPWQRLRGGEERLPRRARGPRRPEDGARALAVAEAARHVLTEPVDVRGDRR